MIKNKIFYFLVFILIIFFGVYSYVLLKEDKLLPLNNKEIQEKSIIKHIRIKNNLIRVDIADTIESRQKGLSGRNFMAEDEGMLFVFEDVGKYFFWMKDMNFPIDILWISEDKEIIHIEKKVLPETFPNLFGPDVPVKYVLELSANYSDRNSISLGDKIEFLP